MNNTKEENIKIPLSMFLHFKYMVSIMPTEQMAHTRKEVHEKAKAFVIEKHKKIVANEAYTAYAKAKESEKQNTLDQYKNIRNSKTGFEV